MKGRGISAAKSQEDAWKLTRLEMKKRQKQEGLLKLELLVQDRESIIAAAQPGGTYMPGIQNNF